MITVIHGDDIVSSRKYFIELKNSSKDSVTLDGKNLTLDALVQTSKSNSLFSSERNIFIENFFSKKTKEIEKLIDVINKSRNSDITIWEDKELSRGDLSSLPKATIKLFKISQNIFSFLDNIKPSRNDNLKDFHKALETADEEAVFYMLIRQFRLLIGLNSPIDEVKRLSDWQIDKLQRQAKFFTSGQLKKIYKKLFDIDLGIKSGTVTNLTRSVDFLLLDI